MKGVYHILNGDALLSLFPTNIVGEKYVARECLVDGSLEGDSLDSFYENRANFLEIDYEDYYKKTVSQFQKIQNFPSGSEINLWFEDDLFCQVNMWFVIDLLVKSYRDFDIYLIRPDKHTQYGFGYYDAQGLENLYTKKTQLQSIGSFSILWKSYKKGDITSLLSEAYKMKVNYPFVLQAVEAHKARIPSKNYMGRPKETLLRIINELKSKDFAKVFREFNKVESIYGFGDVQVKRMYEELKRDKYV